MSFARDDELMDKMMPAGAGQELALSLLDELKRGKLVSCKREEREERFFMPFHCDKRKS